jgi:exodeoxyribonuclease-5
LSKADQVICGFNDNRRKINIELLRRGGFEGTYPTRGSEKLVCLKNDKQRGLFNGMPVALAEVHDEGHEKYFRAKVLVADESGRFTEERGEAKIYKGYFESAVDGNEQRIEADRDFRARERLVELDWGYCITAHKAQGSEWNKVLVVNDGWGLGRKGGEDLHRRWLYTAVTRASKRVAVVGVDRL